MRGIVIASSLLALAGCQSDADEWQVADAVVAEVAERKSQGPPVGEVEASMAGFWRAAPELLGTYNPQLPGESIEAVQDNLLRFPFELELGGGRYVSRSDVKVIRDGYEVIDVDDRGTLTLRLSGEGGRPGRERPMKAWLNEGHLLIRNGVITTPFVPIRPDQRRFY